MRFVDLQPTADNVKIRSASFRPSDCQHTVSVYRNGRSSGCLTHSQEHDSSDKGEDEHETKHSPPCFTLIVVSCPQFLASRSHVVIDGDDVTLDVVCSKG